MVVNRNRMFAWVFVAMAPAMAPLLSGCGGGAPEGRLAPEVEKKAQEEANLQNQRALELQLKRQAEQKK